MSAKVTVLMGEELSRIRQVFIDYKGKRIFSGLLDKQVFEKSDKGYFLHIESRGVASLLIDNEALPESYYNVCLDRIFDRYIKPYGDFLSNISSRKRAYEIIIGKGKSLWEAFCDSSFIITGRKPYMRKDKLITFGYFNTKHKIDDKIINLKSIYNPSKIVSHVVLRDDNGRYTKVFKNKNPYSKNIHRIRYNIQPKEWEDEKMLGVNEIFRNSLENIYHKEILLEGFLDCEIGDSVILKGEELVIKEINTEFSENKIQTKIICCDTNNFNV